LVGWAHFQRERNGALFRVHAVVCAKVLDTADIVREAILRQLQSWFGHQAQLRIDIAGRAE
jgi:hypothetical protein